MSPALAAAIDVARDLAWYPHANFSARGRHLYAGRREAAQRLVERLGAVRSLSANASPQLRALLEAMRRVAACTYSNRSGIPYHERRQAMAQLRGAFDEWDRSQTRVAA